MTILVAVIAGPFLTYFATLKYFKPTTTPEWKAKYSALFDDLKTDSKATALFYTLFLTRRLIFAVLICFFLECQGF